MIKDMNGNKAFDLKFYGKKSFMIQRLLDGPRLENSLRKQCFEKQLQGGHPLA